MKVSYSVVAAGILTPVVSDGTSPDPTKTGVAAFPYLSSSP
jgi:hypothetical protein